MLSIARDVETERRAVQLEPPRDGREGWNGDRYGAFHDLQGWRGYMTAAGFTELAHYYRLAGLPFEQQAWLANVWRKPPPDRACGHEITCRA